MTMTEGSGQIPPPPYRIFEHTADLGVEIYGEDKPDLFRNAALTLADILTDRSRVEGKDEREVVIEGGDREELLVNFLREILSLFNGDGWLLKDCRINSMEDCHLRATVVGEPFARDRHTMDVEIKAITYHGAELRSVPRGWVGKVVCDV